MKRLIEDEYCTEIYPYLYEIAKDDKQNGR